jgi:acetyl esterase/lipase
VGFSVRSWLPQPAAASDITPRARSVILVYAGGGISHLDSFDPHPDAPAEVRGEFSTIQSGSPGVYFSELVPQLAASAQQFSLIRAMRHAERDHGVSAYYMQRGYAQTNPTFDRPENQHKAHPNIGSHVARLRGSTNGLPPYLCVPGLSYLATANYYTAGWMGRRYDPFLLKSNPAAEDFQVQGLVPPADVTSDRVARRLLLSRQLDVTDRLNSDATVIRGLKGNYRQVFDMITAGVSRRVFDLGQETDCLRDDYGRNSHGQACLLARRLVEAGVPFVTIDDFDWDHHGKIFPSLRKQLPVLDRAFATLLRDLDDRGLLDTTLVLLLTDFGRTPQVNSNAGRDHWPIVFSVLGAGAGITAGQVIGASDSIGAEPARQTVTPKDLAATIYHILGLDPFQTYITSEGRSLPMLDVGELIPEWV